MTIRNDELKKIIDDVIIKNNHPLMIKMSIPSIGNLIGLNVDELEKNIDSKIQKLKLFFKQNGKLRSNQNMDKENPEDLIKSLESLELILPPNYFNHYKKKFKNLKSFHSIKKRINEKVNKNLNDKRTNYRASDKFGKKSNGLKKNKKVKQGQSKIGSFFNKKY